MTNTLKQNRRGKQSTFFHANPILTRLSRIDERADDNCASYAGIASKTAVFLIITLIGIIAHLILMNGIFAAQPEFTKIQLAEGFNAVPVRMAEIVAVAVAAVVGFVCELIGIFAPKTIPVTGGLYSFSQGYVISFLVFKVLGGYEYLGLEALVLTIAVIAVMSWLYTSGIIKPDKKFRTVLLTLLLGSVGVGLLTFVGSLIPATREYVAAITQNPVYAIALDVVGIVIAALFLISDFSVIDECVQEQYPKEYEWSAAFGLVFTVIWLYLKILDLLMQLNKKND